MTVGGAVQPEPGRQGKRFALFVTLAYALGWLVCLPMWISGQGLRLPYASLLLLAMMAAPTGAALVAHRALPNGRPLVDVTGLRLGPFRKWWRGALLSCWGPSS